MGVDAPLVGEFRLGRQAGCHLDPGRQTWAPPDQLRPQRYLYPLLQNVLHGRAQAQERGSPSKVSSYFSSASPLFFPSSRIIVLPPEEGARSRSRGEGFSSLIGCQAGTKSKQGVG